MKTERQITGMRGEQEACDYLLKCRHSIIERNWRISRLETDIISMDSRGIHFVEVKTRKAPTSADPEVNVDAAKMRKMANAARRFLSSGKVPYSEDTEIFFDVITVILNGEKAEIEYYPQAFIPTYV